MAKSAATKRNRSLKWLKWVITVLVLAGAGLAAYTFWPQEEEVVESPFGESAVTRGDLSKAVQGSGNIQPSINRTVTVSDDVTITKLSVGVGDTIEAGGALAEVDHESLRDTIQSQEDQIAQKELQIQRSRLGFDSYEINAPRDGRIRELHAKLGEDASDTGRAYGALCVISTGGKMKATLEITSEQTYEYGFASPSPTAEADSSGSSSASATPTPSSTPVHVIVDSLPTPVPVIVVTPTPTPSASDDSGDGGRRLADDTDGSSGDGSGSSGDGSGDSSGDGSGDGSDGAGTFSASLAAPISYRSTEAAYSAAATPIPTPIPSRARYNVAAATVINDWTWWFLGGEVTLAKGNVITVYVDGEGVSASVTAVSQSSISVEIPGDMYAIGAKVSFMAPWGYETIASGELELSESVTVTGSGKVEEIHIQDGQMVTRGQLLFELDETDAQLSLEEQELSLEQLRDSLAENETKLEEDRLTSPISGTVIDLLVEEGNTVKSGEAFVRIMDATEMELTIAVDELDISEVRTGMDAKITIDAFEDEEFKGTVKSIGIIGATSNGVTTYEVVVSMKGEAKIKPAMSATADIVIEATTDALLIPVEALVKRNEEYFARVPATATAETTDSAQESGGGPQDAGGEARPSAAPNADAQQGARNRDTSDASGAQSAVPGGAGAEFTLAPIKIGLVGDTYAEVLEGLSEGDIVLVPSTSAAQTGNFMMGGMMGGGMMMGGGGPPASGGGPPAGGGGPPGG